MTEASEQGDAFAEDSAGTTRTEAFSDAVFAIAMTLLVLTIHVPTQSEITTQGDLAAVLAAAWPSYLAYLATFLTIGVTWMNHHAAFGRMARLDPAIQWWNLLLLLAVSFAPFPTELVATSLSADLSSRSARTAAVIFGVVSALRPLVWVQVWGHLRRHPNLLRKKYSPDFARTEQRRAGVGFLLYTLSAGLGLVVPIATIVLALGLSIFYALTATRPQNSSPW